MTTMKMTTTIDAEPPLNREQRRALQRAVRMPGSARRKPGHIRRDPVGYVTESMTLISENDDGRYVTNWKIRVHGAMTRVVRGEANRDDMNDLVAAWNVTSALCNIHGLEDECVIRSKEALMAICKRANEIQRVVCKANEIVAINEMIDLHDQWIESITVRQMEEALAWCKRHENRSEVLLSNGIPK